MATKYTSWASVTARWLFCTQPPERGKGNTKTGIKYINNSSRHQGRGSEGAGKDRFERKTDKVIRGSKGRSGTTERAHSRRARKQVKLPRKKICLSMRNWATQNQANQATVFFLNMATQIQFAKTKEPSALILSDIMDLQRQMQPTVSAMFARWNNLPNLKGEIMGTQNSPRRAGNEHHTKKTREGSI